MQHAAVSVVQESSWCTKPALGFIQQAVVIHGWFVECLHMCRCVFGLLRAGQMDSDTYFFLGLSLCSRKQSEIKRANPLTQHSICTMLHHHVIRL